MSAPCQMVYAMGPMRFRDRAVRHESLTLSPELVAGCPPGEIREKSGSNPGVIRRRETEFLEIGAGGLSVLLGSTALTQCDLSQGSNLGGSGPVLRRVF